SRGRRRPHSPTPPRLMARHLAREMQQHRAEAPHRFRTIHASLVQQLPDYDRALIGWAAILGYLHNTLPVRRPNGQPLPISPLLRWRRDLDFPLLRGGWNPSSRCLSPPLTTAF